MLANIIMLLSSNPCSYFAVSDGKIDSTQEIPLHSNAVKDEVCTETIPSPTIVEAPSEMTSSSQCPLTTSPSSEVRKRTTPKRPNTILATWAVKQQKMDN